MRDAQQRLEKLVIDAADCEMIAQLTTIAAKRRTFLTLAETYKAMAEEMRALINSGDLSGDRGDLENHA